MERLKTKSHFPVFHSRYLRAYQGCEDKTLLAVVGGVGNKKQEKGYEKTSKSSSISGLTVNGVIGMFGTCPPFNIRK